MSTRNLLALPNPAALWRRLISLAALDLVLSPEWESRYHSFDAGWGPSEHMGSMRDGCGDDYFVGFSAAGAFLKGFAHEAPMSPYRVSPPVLWEGIYRGCPGELTGFRDEPAFSGENATFAAWWEPARPGWRSGVDTFAPGPDPDGSERLLRLLGGGPERYFAFAEEVFEVELSLEAITVLYEHGPLRQEVLATLAVGSDVDLAECKAEIEELGYGAEFPFF